LPTFGRLKISTSRCRWKIYWASWPTAVMNNKIIAKVVGLVVVLAVVIGLGLIAKAPARSALADMREQVTPTAGVELPVVWGDLTEQLIATGIIDQTKLNPAKITATTGGRIMITKDNAKEVLNLLWALGLANNNRILTAGPMTDEQYGGDPSRFASTGGWTLAVGEGMDHYAKHELITLTPAQQLLVESVSRNVYRPCCDNPTHFPDCNHGLAMLGLLELGASQGLNEEELYQLALVANRFWFPDTYLTIAQYFGQLGQDWQSVEPRVILGADYSSGSGFAKIKEQVVRSERGLGTSCGV